MYQIYERYSTSGRSNDIENDFFSLLLYNMKYLLHFNLAVSSLKISLHFNLAVF